MPLSDTHGAGSLLKMVFCGMLWCGAQRQARRLLVLRQKARQAERRKAAPLIAARVVCEALEAEEHEEAEDVEARLDFRNFFVPILH